MTFKFISVAVFLYLDDAKRASLVSHQQPGRQRQIGPRWVVTIEGNDYSVYVQDKDGGYEIECKNRLFSIRSNWDLGSNILQGYINDEPVTFPHPLFERGISFNPRRQPRRRNST